ncbi:unnamed protein product [Trypanosoma congolense IL3000]|uniref:WGS project CAEQ00000000 data, annotated contig 2445 n=1 Tax=Trypanosoma congolense (strain IL3000) TaxID=1068625 RepID=F9WE82_TRYCI|nr:unnamed protein product [Trypanosoma congolense IL3000]
MKYLLEKVEGSGVTEIWNSTKRRYQEVLMNKKHVDRSVEEIRLLLEENKTNKRYERGKAENLINTAIQAQQYNDREYEEANQTMSQLEDQQKTARMAAKEALEKLYDSEKSGGLYWPAACDAQTSKVIFTGTALQAALVTWRARTKWEESPPENCPVHAEWEKSVEKAASHMIQ